MNLNGSTALAESLRIQLGRVRGDWKVEAAEQRARMAEGLLEIERICSTARERIAQVKDGLPGQTGENGLPGKDGAPGRDAIDGQPGIDGKDGAPGRDGRDGEPGKDGRDGIDGAPGIDGKDGAPGRDGIDGAPGRGGDPGRDGAPGVFAAPSPFKAGQITYGGQLTYHEGSTFCALRDTAQTPPHADFQPVAYRGRDGKDAYSGRACGLFDATASYRVLDVVALNGSEWRAVRDNPGACPGDGWMLGAKGSKGKPGEQGLRGEQGPRGDPGIGLAHVELLDTTLVLTRTDGSALSVDLAALVG